MLDHAMPGSLVHFEALIEQELKSENQQIQKVIRRWSTIASVTTVLVGITALLALMLTQAAAYAVCPLSFFGLIFIWGLADQGQIRKSSKSKLLNEAAKGSTLESQRLKLVFELKDFLEKGTMAERLHPAICQQLESISQEIVEAREWLESEPCRNVLDAELRVELSKDLELASRQLIFAISNSFRKKGVQRKVWNERVRLDPDASNVQEKLARVGTVAQEVSKIRSQLGGLRAGLSTSTQLKSLENAVYELQQDVLDQNAQ